MHNLNVNEALKELGSSTHGLKDKQAKENIKKYGKNELEKVKKQSFLRSFFKQFLNIMVAILLFSAIVSLAIAISNKQYGDLFEGFVILFIVIMNALIGVFQENKAQASIEDLQKNENVSVKVLRNGALTQIDSKLLAVGDIVYLEAGNLVMADLRLIESNNFACDESSLTGESVSAEKNADIVLNKNTPLAERVNMAYSGSMVTSGKAKGVVVATGKSTEMGKIASMLFHSKKEVTPLQKSIDKIGKILTYSVLVVCAIILIIELIGGHGIMNAVMVAVSLAVAAIPESLPAVITIILALGVQQLAKNKCIIKHLHAVETLGSCEIICTDKTGTLTMNKMKVTDCFSNNSHSPSGKTYDEFIKCMTLCNNTHTENGKLVGEPTELALYEYANPKYMGEKKKIIHEIPFNSTRKMMTVLINENGLMSYTKGAPERVVERCKYIMIDGKPIEFTPKLKAEVQTANEQMTAQALRVIGFACKNFYEYNPNLDAEEEMVFLGLAGMIDNPRPEVKASIEKCFKAGLKPVMITGDHKKTAFTIAKLLGIAKTESEVITGEELDKLSDAELKKFLHRYTVYARVSPEHKVRIVKAYKSIKKIVAMTGDGVNDAPSLKIADIGVGMGKSGTDVVKNVADMVVTDDNFASIVVAVEEGRKVYSNIQKALQFLISTNCVEVFGMLIALLFFPKYTFLLPTQMLFINLVTDSLPAFALGMEKIEPQIMSAPPRNSKAGLFAGKVGVAIIYQSILQTAIAVLVFVVGVYCYSPEVASSMVFFTIIFMQLLHSLNCKTNESLFDTNIFNNKTFNLCFVITLVLNLSVAVLPFMYPLFGLEFLNFSQWLMVIIASISIIPLCEVCKLIINSRPKLKYLKRKVWLKK